jgi:hypothetical protein
LPLPSAFAVAVAAPVVAEGDLGWWKTEFVAEVAREPRVGESPIFDQGADPAGVVVETFSGGIMTGGKGGARTGVVGQNLDLIWVDSCATYSDLLRCMVDPDPMEGRPFSSAAFLPVVHGHRLRSEWQIQ